MKIDSEKLLSDMYRDDYFPNHLVDKIRDIILDACRRIEGEKPENLDELYRITCAATEKINELEEEFDQHGSELETAAREDIALSFEHVAHTYGFDDADIEELIATREW